MGDKSTIEWTEASWNPTVGCSIVSPGCINCYAMRVAAGLTHRFASRKYDGLTKTVNGNPVWTGEVRLDERALLQPLKWKRGRKIFVNSMSDLFHEALDDWEIAMVYGVMTCATQHDYQVLTKRADRAKALLSSEEFWDQVNCYSQGFAEEHSNPLARRSDDYRARSDDHDPDYPPPNIWLGVSCERQQEWDERIPYLKAAPAAIRFVSVEPMLGEITCGDLAGIHWVIVGGESGPNARPMHPEWARSIRDQCAASDVPFFFKQWGEWADTEDWPSEMQEHLELLGKADGNNVRVGKKRAGRLLDGREHNEFPEVRS